MRARVGVMVLLVVAVLAVGGCSSEVRDYQNTLGAWSESLSNNPGPEMQYDQEGKATGYDGSEVRAHLDGLNELLGELEQVTPPEELTDAYQQVVEAFRGVCKEEERFYDAFALGDAAATKAASDKVSTQLQDFTSAWKQLTQAIEEAR